MKIINFLLLLLLSFPSLGLAGDSFHVSLKRYYTVDPAHLKLKDVFDTAKTSSEIVDRYGEVSLPETGGEGSIGPAHVLLALSKAGANLSDIRLLTTSDVRFISNQQPQVVKLIRKKAYQKLSESLNQSAEDIVVKFYELPKDLPKRSAFSDLAVDIKRSSAQDYQFLVRFLSHNSRTLTTARLKGKVKTKTFVLMAKRPIQSGEYVTKDDFYETKKLVENKNNYFSKLAQLGSSRWVVKQDLEADQPLKRLAINYAATIRKGAIVSLYTGDKRFKVRALGRVKDILDNGATVLVENIDSKKELIGLPVSPSEVKIIY